MSDAKVEVKITEDLVKPIIQAKIEAAIVTSLNEEQGLVEKTVAAVLSEKVDNEGKVSKSDYYNKYTRIEYLSTRMIQNAAEAAIVKWAENNQKQIEDAMYKELSKKAQTSNLVKSILNGLVDATKSSWRFKVDFDFLRSGD